MKKLAFSVLFATAVLFAGCISIPKPDWQPGTTAPAPIVGVRPTCTLPAQWAWNNIYSQWVCVVPPPVYYIRHQCTTDRYGMVLLSLSTGVGHAVTEVTIGNKQCARFASARRAHYHFRSAYCTVVTVMHFVPIQLIGGNDETAHVGSFDSGSTRGFVCVYSSRSRKAV